MEWIQEIKALSPATQMVLAVVVATLIYFVLSVVLTALRVILGALAAVGRTVKSVFVSDQATATRSASAGGKRGGASSKTASKKGRGGASFKVQAPADSSSSSIATSTAVNKQPPAPPGVSLKTLIKTAGKAKGSGNGADRHADSELFITTLRGHTDNVTGLAFSSEGSVLATACEDRELRVFTLPRDDIFTQKAIPFKTFNLRLGVQDVAFSASPNALAVLTRGSANAAGLCFVDVSGREADIKSQIDSGVFASRNTMALCLRGSETSGAAGGPPVIVVASEGPELRLYTAAPGLPVLGKVDTGGMRTYWAAVSPDGRYVAAATFTSDTKIYEVSFDRAGGFAGLAKVMDLKGHKKKVTSVAFSPDSTKAVTASEDGTLRIWNINVRYKQQEDPKCLATASLPEARQVVTRFAWGPAGHIAAISGANLYFLDARSGEVVETVQQAHSKAIADVAWAPGRFGGPQGAVHVLATAGEDGRCRLWRAPWPLA